VVHTELHIMIEHPIQTKGLSKRPLLPKKVCVHLLMSCFRFRPSSFREYRCNRSGWFAYRSILVGFNSERLSILVTDHDEAIQVPLSALQRLALQRKQAVLPPTENARDKPSGLASLAKGLFRKTPTLGTQPVDTPSIISTPSPNAPVPKTSKLSALAQKSLEQRARSSAVSTSQSPTPQDTTSKTSSVSKLALRIKAQKDAQEAAFRPPVIDARKPELVALRPKPEFELFINLRPSDTRNITSHAGLEASHANKLRTGPSPFGNILVSRQYTAGMASSLAQIYSGVVSGPSSAFQFNTPSPDDTVIAAREGTRLNAYKKASTAIGSRK
jgi:hypothetical protein